MSNHRSVHLNSGLLPLPLPLPFPFLLLLCFHQACLVLFGSVLVRTNGGKRSLQRHGSACWVGNMKKNPLFTYMYLALSYTELQTIYQNSETHERAGHE